MTAPRGYRIGWLCDQCGRWWPHQVNPYQDATDVAWRGDQARRFCDPDCFNAYSESMGTQP